MLFAFSFFFFNDTATTEIYTLSLHDALPISRGRERRARRRRRGARRGRRRSRGDAAARPPLARRPAADPLGARPPGIRQRGAVTVYSNTWPNRTVTSSRGTPPTA